MPKFLLKHQSAKEPFSIPSDFAFVQIAMAMIGLEYFFLFVLTNQSRAATFTKQFLEDNFQEEHKQAYPTESVGDTSGYPDTGSGRYSQKLPYKSWVEFNKVQRVHGNFLEALPSILVSLAIAGISYPRISAGLGALYFIGRFLYIFFYITSTKGSSHPLRSLGSVIGQLTNVALWIIVIVSGIQKLNT